MQKQKRELGNLLIRYVIILILGLGNLAILYKILKPLTIQTLALLFSIFTKTSVSANLIITKTVIIEIIPACVAASAYYLLVILILATPNIEFIKRIKILIISFVLLFILNIIRIIILALASSSTYFEITHILFWYFISIIFVVVIWLALVKKFKIKSVPAYSDIKFLHKLIHYPKKSKRHN